MFVVVFIAVFVAEFDPYVEKWFPNAPSRAAPTGERAAWRAEVAGYFRRLFRGCFFFLFFAEEEGESS